jgi:protein-S-isoprenylcysteine O-methyltransferase Ste14
VLVAIALTFWLRKRPPKVRVAKRDWTSLIGMFLQGAAYFFVWWDPLRRNVVLPTKSGSQAAEWALAARLVEGHELIQDGPYRFVRNPIYTGMFGMLVATGLAAGRWLDLLIAIALFAVGTYIHIRSEERLLREAFGSEFEAYAHNVPALIPRIY